MYVFVKDFKFSATLVIVYANNLKQLMVGER